MEEYTLLLVAAGCFIIALITGIIGFKESSPEDPGRFKGIAKMIFFLFLSAFTITATFGILEKFFHPEVEIHFKFPFLKRKQ